MMAKKFKRVMSLFMVFVLCLGMLNLGVVAAEGFTPTYADSTVQIEGEDVPVYHVHNSTDTTEDSLVANRAQDPEVYASKTIYPTADENLFEIELKVETTEKITEIRSEPDAAVSLVIDYSSSMEEKMNPGVCVHCGEKEENAERVETYTDRWGRERTRTVKYHECIEGKSYEEDPTTKMDAAIAAAQDFVRAFAADATTGKRWISVTIFDKEAVTITGDAASSWVDVATDSGLQEVLDIIGGIVADSGTNVAHGLALGSATLDEETVAELQHKYVVLVGDGLPYNTCDAPTGNWAKYSTETSSNHVNAEKWARKIREGQGVQIFSVYVEENGTTSSKGYKWFDTFSNQTVLATNTTTLVQAFEQQLAFISFGIEAWSVTDPMGANIQFVDKVNGQNNYSVIGDTLTWNLINDIPEVYDADGGEVAIDDMIETETYTFIYTFRYSIRLDNTAEGFVEGDYYNANGNTYLQYYLLDNEGNPIDLNGNTTATLLKLDFVVPAVKGFLGEFSFTKENADGEALSGAQFALIHDGRACTVCGGVSVGTMTAASDENGLVSFSQRTTLHHWL